MFADTFEIEGVWVFPIRRHFGWGPGFRAGDAPPRVHIHYHFGIVPKTITGMVFEYL